MGVHDIKKKRTMFLFVCSIIILLITLIFFRMEIGFFSLRTAYIPQIAFFLNPNASLALEIGNYYFNVGGNGAYDLEKAEKYFKKALEIDPNVPDAWHQLARIDFLRGDFPNALSKINTQLDLHRDSLMASYYIRGLIEGYSGNYENAEKDFLRFFEWDRNNWAVYNDIAWIYFQQGEYEKTRRVAEGGLAHFPNNPWLLNMAGLARMNLENKDAARAYFQKALWWADTLTTSDWHKAYPGNNPHVAEEGISEMKKAIKTNLALIGG